MYSQNIEHIYNTDKILVQIFFPYVDHEKQYTNPVTHIILQDSFYILSGWINACTLYMFI